MNVKRYLITGASRGIGRHIAIRLAGRECELILHGRDREALDETCRLAEKRGAAARPVLSDLALAEGVEALVAASGDGQLVGLIHCAGVALVKPVDRIDTDEWQRTLAVNVTAPFLLTQRLLPLIPAGGAIVHIMSIAARVGFPGWSGYAMSKFALEGFSQSLREELRPRGIRVINVYPSATDTELWNGIEGEWPRQKMLDPGRVAEAVAFALEQPPEVLVDTINVGNIAGTL